MDVIEKSLAIALNAYAGKKDKAGKTYILHPLRIMAKMDTSEEMSVALLHDVIEDSEITAKDLLQEGIPENIVAAVQALTKIEGEDYEQFVDRVLKNKLAAKIKKADIEDNINVLRLTTVTPKDLERIAKYHKAWLKINSSL
jgi:(p)ppGpp synthase/HD superfamily hydrolase